MAKIDGAVSYLPFIVFLYVFIYLHYVILDVIM